MAKIYTESKKSTMIRNVLAKLVSSYMQHKHRKILKQLKNPNPQQYLAQLILRANVSPFYAKRFAKAKLIQNGKVNLQNFSKLEPLTKKDIRENYEQLIIPYPGKYRKNTSGGSTGNPVVFLQDQIMLDWVEATLIHYHNNILGVDYTASKKLLLWGLGRDEIQGWQAIMLKIRFYLTNAEVINTYAMKHDKMDNYIKTLNTFKPKILRGYAGSVFAYAQHITDKNIRVHEPKYVICTAETLTKPMRKTIQSAFPNSIIIDFYGSRESPALVAQDPKGQMRILDFNHYLEVVNTKNQPTKQRGNVLVTTLHNHIMPLIRYQIGDEAIPSTPGYLKEISGRITDNFITRKGDIVYGEFFSHLFYFRPWLDTFRVVQEDVDNIAIYVILKDSIPAKDKKHIESQILQFMGKVKIQWKTVKSIPKMGLGKHLYTVSKVKR